LLLRFWTLLRQKIVYSAWLLLHVLLIVTISCRQVVWLVAHRLTIFPSSFSSFAQKLESAASVTLAQNLASSNPLRRTLLTYVHVAGTERGYGYFAPNVPGSYKLVFELHYPDGRIETTLPAVNSNAAGLRVASLLDEIGRTRHDALREYIIKEMARSIWREHPDAIMVRAVFGVSTLPSLVEFEQGKRESYEFLYAYEFSLGDDSVKPQNP
jgi:hypothetical protein